MSVDDRDNDMPIDWTAVKDAAGRQSQSARGDRAGSAQRRRSPRGPKKSAKMLAFPLKARRDFVARLAAQIAGRPADAGEFHLLQQLDRQRDVLARKGVPKLTIERELRELSSAVRAELWRLLLGGRA